MPRFVRRRNRVKRRWGGRRKSFGKSKTLKYGALNRTRQPVQFFKRSIFIPAGASGGIPLGQGQSAGVPIDTFTSLVFRLGDLPNSNELTQLYDQFSIKGVKVHIMPKFDTAMQAGTGTNPTAQNQMQRVFSVLDYDDNNAPTALSEMMQYENLKTTKGIQDHKRYFVPKVLSSAYGGLASTNYMPKAKQWLDCNTPSTPHYGMKIGFSAANLGLNYDLKIDYYVAFKNVR